MLTIFSKEINTFFSSLIGYIAIGVFLLVTGLMMFVFPDTSLLDYNYATLDQLFSLAPMIFMFLIPAVTMRSFAYYTVHQLGSPTGNLDSGAIQGSYIGLFLLAGVYTAIGVFASSLIDNQIVSFILATFLCFFMYSGFLFISKMPFFFGSTDTIVQMFGIDHHYSSISRGVVDTRDIIYFISIIALFIAMTLVSLEKRKW